MSIIFNSIDEDSDYVVVAHSYPKECFFDSHELDEETKAILHSLEKPSVNFEKLKKYVEISFEAVNHE